MKFFTKTKDPWVVKNLLEDHKIVHFLGEANQQLCEEIASSIGKLIPMEEDEDGNKTGNLWTDIKYISHKSWTFSHSNSLQPLHTDGSYERNPPDISFFYCIKQADTGGETFFVDLDDILSHLERYNKTLLLNLKTKELKFSKGNDEKLSSIIKNDKINWNYFRVERGTLAEEFKNFLDTTSLPRKEVRLKKDEAIFFWDQLVLHGRNSFVGNRWLRKGGIGENIWNRTK